MFIIDPASPGKQASQLLSLHAGTVDLVLQALAYSINSLFDGWQVAFDDFRKVIVRGSTTECAR